MHILKRFNVIINYYHLIALNSQIRLYKHDGRKEIHGVA